MAERRRLLAAERHRLDLHHSGLPEYPDVLQQHLDLYPNQHVPGARRASAGRWYSTANPNPNMVININNNGGPHRAIDIVDGGFLELVRMGVKPPNDPTIAVSLATYDNVIGETVGPYATGWFR